MSLKVALWCPHGRAGLPLAARLLLEQLPPELVVWSSDAAEPAEPGPDVAECDLGLVLCASVPPPPPAWRASFGGRLLVMPGSSASWDDATRAGLETWGKVALLVDVLPDECGNAVLRSWYENGRELFWLPAVFDGSVALEDGLGWAFVETGFQERPGVEVRIGARTVLLSHDPVAAGMILRRGAAAGAVVGVLGNAGSLVRRRFLGGQVIDHLAWPRETVLGGPSLRASLRSLSRPPKLAPRPPPPFSWTDWLEAAALENCASDKLPTAACAARFLVANQRARAERGFSWPAGAPPVLDRKLPFVLYPSLVLDRAALGEMAACTPEGWWYAYLGTMLEADAGWAGDARVRLTAEPDAGLARLLWCAVCDGFCRRSTRAVSDAVGHAFETSLALPERGGSDWELGRLLVLAATGRFDAADEEAQRLLRTNPAAVVEYLGWALRAWAPALEVDESDMIPANAATWWLRLARACVDAQQPGSRLLLARGELWLGDPSAACDLTAGETPAELGQLVLEAWKRGAHDVARRWGERAVSTPLPREPEAHLRALVVRAWITREGNLADELRNLAASAPQLFHPERPSHSRATWLAGAFHRVGATEEAAVWIALAQVQDPMARERLARLMAG